MFVLIGENKGDYDDFCQRYREAVAVSSSKELLEEYQVKLESRTAPRAEDNNHEYVEFDIEEVVQIESGVWDEEPDRAVVNMAAVRMLKLEVEPEDSSEELKKKISELKRKIGVAKRTVQSWGNTAPNNELVEFLTKLEK